VKPFQIDIPPETLDDLQARLTNTQKPLTKDKLLIPIMLY
jgi:hypothetical protein